MLIKSYEDDNDNDDNDNDRANDSDNDHEHNDNNIFERKPQTTSKKNAPAHLRLEFPRGAAIRWEEQILHRQSARPRPKRTLQAQLF